MSAVGTRFALCPPYGLMSAGMTKWGDRAEPRSPDAATATRSHNPDDGYSKTKRPAREAPALPSGTNAFVCSMEVEDFDRIAGKIIDAGGRIALPKFAVPGVCWQGYFLDAEANTFGIFQPDPSAT